MADSMELRTSVREYIIKNILAGKQEGFSDQTTLISGGLADSISTLHLVDYLEKTFGIEFEPHEVDKEYLDTVDRIVQFVESKKS